MALSETAQRHRQDLFGTKTPTLNETDAELMEAFDNFAFDEVLGDSDLDERTRLIVQLASMIAAPALTPFRAMAGSALDTALNPEELKEIVYQAVPYVGMAKVVDFLHTTNDLLSTRGINLPLAGQAATTPDSRWDRGLDVQKQIVGDDVVEQMHAKAPEDAKHFQRYLTANCFGDYVARPGLSITDRELLTFSMLASLGGADAQVKGHVAANLRVGNDRARLLAVLTVLVPFIGYPRTLNALATLNEVVPAVAHPSPR